MRRMHSNTISSTFKSNFRLILLRVNKVIVLGKLPEPSERNSCLFGGGVEWDYNLNFVYDYTTENDSPCKQRGCTIRSGRWIAAWRGKSAAEISRNAIFAFVIS